MNSPFSRVKMSGLFLELKEIAEEALNGVGYMTIEELGNYVDCISDAASELDFYYQCHKDEAT